MFYLSQGSFKPVWNQNTADVVVIFHNRKSCDYRLQRPLLVKNTMNF